MGPTHPLLDRLLARGRRHRPVIGAHRGASARAPENTLAAFRAALEDGAELSMSELRRLDAGRHKGRHWAGEPIPELGDVFAAVRDYLLVNVEVKCGTAAVPVLARCVAEHDMADAVIVSSFDPAVGHPLAAPGP